MVEISAIARLFRLINNGFNEIMYQAKLAFKNDRVNFR